MFLTAYNLSNYLISRGLLDAQSIVDGDYTVSEHGRRNRNFKVHRRKQPGIFVKQVKVLDPLSTATVKREAGFYRAVHGDPKFSALREMIPEFLDYESRRHAVALRLADGAESLAEKQGREGIYREDTAHLLGHALGTIHLHGPAMHADPATRGLFTSQLPWPITLDQTGYSFLTNIGPIGPALAAEIQKIPTLQPKLSALRAEWRYDCLIHGDMKFDNCLIRTGPDGVPNLTIVDWELADIGEAAWDLGSIYKDLLMAVLMSSEYRESAVRNNTSAPPLVTLESVQPAALAFWNGYHAGRRMPPQYHSAFLDKVVRFTAARMVLAVLEYLFNSNEMNQLGHHTLQTAVWLLEAPQDGRLRMIGA